MPRRPTAAAAISAGVLLPLLASRHPPRERLTCVCVLQMDFSYLKCLDKIYPLPPKRGDAAKLPSSKRTRGDGGEPASKRQSVGEDGTAVPKEVCAPPLTHLLTWHRPTSAI